MNPLTLLQKALMSIGVIGLIVLSGYLAGRSHERANWNKWAAKHAAKAQDVADATAKAQSAVDKFAALQPARIKQIETRYVTKSEAVKNEFAILKTQADTLGEYMECPLNCRVPSSLLRVFDDAARSAGEPDATTPPATIDKPMRTRETQGRDADSDGGSRYGKWAAARALRRAERGSHSTVQRGSCRN